MKTLHFIKILLITLLLITSCSPLNSNEIESSDNTRTNQNEIIEEDVTLKQIVGRVGDEVPLTKREMIRIISLSLYGYDTILNISKNSDINLSSINSDDEVYNYTLCLLSEGIINIEDVEIDGKSIINDEVTLLELDSILRNINEESEFTLKVDENTKDLKISYGFFTEVMTKTLKNLADNDIYQMFNLSITDEVVLATNDQNKEIPENYIITDYGTAKVSFLNFSNYLNHSLKVLKRDNEIVFVTEVVSNTPTIKSAYILENTPNKISVFTGGVNRIYNVENGISDDVSGKLCDIRIKGNNALEVTILGNEIVDEIKIVEKDKILFKENGVIGINNNLSTLKFYDVTKNTPKFKNSDIVFVGEENIKFVLSDDEIVGGILFEEKNFENTRVLINNSDFSTTKFQEVKFSGNLLVNGQSYDTFEVYADDLNDYEFITIESADSSEIYFDSITRNVTGETPKYFGFFDVFKTPYGLVVVNDLPLEKYLEKVVPSEMPSTYNIEALKAQAVSARTYAVKQINDKVFQEYGASIDDSVLSQVYNNIDITESTTNAVQETAGEVLTFDNEIISTNFFSTSSGFTSNSGEVWGDAKTKSFPFKTPEYLSSQNLLYSDLNYNLNDEEELLEYFKDTTLEAVDSDVSWFRWNVTLDFDTVSNNINNFIPSRNLITDYLIDVDEEFLQNKDFGNIKYINIKNRGENGLVTELEVISDKYNLNVKGEYNIRKVLAPKGKTLTRKDNSTIENYSILPSGFFAIEKGQNSIGIFGGGNGHGVGLSQNGANSLGKNGASYKEILNTFYKNTELSKIN